MKLTSDEIHALSSRPDGVILINAGPPVTHIDARTIERHLKVFGDVFSRSNNDRRPDVLVAPTAAREALARVQSPAEPEFGSVLEAASDRYPWMRNAIWTDAGALGHRGGARWVLTRRLDLDRDRPARVLYIDFCEPGEDCQCPTTVESALDHIEVVRFGLATFDPAENEWSDVDIIGYAAEIGWRG